MAPTRYIDDPLDPDTWPDDLTIDDMPTSVFVDDDTAEAQVQLDIFAAAGSVADLPLFSGTAMRAKVQPFVEQEPEPKQDKLL